MHHRVELAPTALLLVFLLVVGCATDPTPPASVMSTQVKPMTRAHNTLTARAPTATSTSLPAPSPRPNPSPTPSPTQSPTQTSTPTRQSATAGAPRPTVVSTVCIIEGRPTGEADFPIDLLQPPPERVYPDQRVAVRFRAGYTWITPIGVHCHSDASGWSTLGVFHWISNFRPVRMLLDGHELLATECGYDCNVAFVIPESVSLGSHELEVESHPKQRIFRTSRGGPALFEVEVLSKGRGLEEKTPIPVIGQAAGATATLQPSPAPSAPVNTHQHRVG